MWGGLDSLTDNDVVEVDYYQILGCTENSSLEQITAEYKVRALRCHPDKNPGNSTLIEFQKLQEARDILTDPEKKKEYDQWRKCGIKMPFPQWKYLNSRCKMTMHWATPKLNIMVEDSANSRQDNDIQAKLTKSSTGQRGEVKWGYACGKSWESDGQRPIYSQFRSYEI